MAARELGCATNVIAANLRTGRSHTVGVLVDQMVSPYAARIIKGINRVMREAWHLCGYMRCPITIRQ